MTRARLVNLHNYLYIKYRNQMQINFVDTDQYDFGAYIELRLIEIPEYTKNHPTEWSLFAFLHEIGHIMTNTTKMKRCEQEYRATQWAIQEAQEIGFKIPKSYINRYQEYIWNWRETSVKCHGKNIPTYEELTLKAS